MPRVYYPQVEATANAHGIDLLFWHIQEGESELQSLAGCAEIHLAGMEHIRSTARRMEKWAERVLLSFWYGSGVVLEHRPNGAPYVAGAADVMSISHTGCHLAVARSAAAMGIDIEQRSPRALRLTRRFLDAREAAWVQAQACAEDAATLLWSAKEAAYKCAQIDGLSLLEGIRVIPSVVGEIWTVRVQPPDQQSWQEYRLYAAILPEFTFALCF